MYHIQILSLENKSIKKKKAKYLKFKIYFYLTRELKAKRWLVGRHVQNKFSRSFRNNN